MLRINSIISFWGILALILALIGMVKYLVWQNKVTTEESDLSFVEIVKVMSSIGIAKKLEEKLQNKSVFELRRELVAINGTVEENKSIQLVAVIIAAILTMFHSACNIDGESIDILLFILGLLVVCFINACILIVIRYNNIKKGVIELLIEEKGASKGKCYRLR